MFRNGGESLRLKGGCFTVAPPQLLLHYFNLVLYYLHPKAHGCDCQKRLKIKFQTFHQNRLESRYEASERIQATDIHGLCLCALLLKQYDSISILGHTTNMNICAWCVVSLSHLVVIYP